MWHGYVTIIFRSTEAAALQSAVYDFHDGDYLRVALAMNDVVADAPISGWVENVVSTIYQSPA